MSNTNNNLQTQTSNVLHNAIMEEGGKDRPPMLVPGNYVQWKSRIKRYIDTKPNNELIHYCLQTPLYKFKWTEKSVPVAEGSSETTTEGLKQGESINVQDLETNLYWEFGKFTSRDDESLESYYSRFVTLVKQSQELKTVSYHKLYDILKQHQNEVNEIRAERLACTANPLALVTQQQPVYYPQNHPNHHTQNSSTRSQQVATRNRGKAIVNSPPPTYDQEPKMVAEDDALSKEKEIDKLMDLISLSFKKIYKPTNNNLRTSSNTSRGNQDNTLRINRGTEYDNQRVVNVAKEQSINVKDEAYHKEKMILSKQEEARFQLNVEQADRRDDTNDEHDDQELEAHYMYMAQIQEVTPDTADNSGPIFDTEPLKKDDDYLAREHDLLASLIGKLKCEIDDSKNRNKLLESSNKTLFVKLKGEIEDFKNKNKSLESLNNHFKEANNELSKTNQLLFKDLKKFQAELDRYHDVNYASKVEINCAKAKGDLMSYKMESQKSFNEYTRKINDLNKMILEMKKELFAHQETISIMSQEKEAQNKFYKTREEKEIEKVIALENKVKVLDDILYKPGQSVQTMNMLNRNCKTSFVKPDYLKKAQRANPRLYDIVTAQILPQNVKSILKNTNVIVPGMYNVHTKHNQTITPQLPQDIRKTNKRVSFSTGVISNTSVSRPQLNSNRLEYRVLHNNSEGKKQQVEDHHRNF
ncbi:hypothetical protein Tco_0693805 [Tanacetum coccineum]